MSQTNIYSNFTVKLITMLFAETLIASCNSYRTVPDKSAQNVGERENNALETHASIYRFTVSFISIGTGIDHEAQQSFLDFFEDFKRKNNFEISFEVVLWGREGETDYCINLSTLSEQERVAFIDSTKDKLGFSKLIRYAENSYCKNK